MNKLSVLLIGLISFAFLFVFSVLFYKERTVFLDISFHLFCILKDHAFAIQNFRFGAFFTQLFPLIGCKLGLSLSTIACLYSVSFVLLPFIVFIILILSKQVKIALAYLLFLLIMTTHTFYWIQSELPQGIAFLFLFTALLETNLQKAILPVSFTPFASILIFIISFSHPLLLFPFLFFIVYYWILKYPNRSVLLAVLFLFLVFYTIKLIFFKTDYDSGAMSGIKNLSLFFPNYIKLQSTKNFIHYFIHDYYLVSFLFFANLAFYLKTKNCKSFLFILFSFLGFALLVSITYPNGADQFYLENQYLLLSIFVIVPFVYEVLPQLKDSNWSKQLIVLLLILVSIYRIESTHDYYTNRLNWYRSKLEVTNQLEHRKIIFKVDTSINKQVLMTWASSCEFWLLSTLESGISRSIIIEEVPNEFDWVNSNKAFIGKWGSFDYEKLDRRYFKFNDTSVYVKY